MAKSTIFLRELIANAILKRQHLVLNNVYVGLFKTMPLQEDASDGVEHDLTNVDSGYKRVHVTNKWDQDISVLPVVRFKLNSILAFEAKSGGWLNNYSSADVVGVGMWDSETAGNCLMYTSLNPQRTIYPNQDLDIDTSGLIIDLTGI